jgi:hypothetical protein
MEKLDNIVLDALEQRIIHPDRLPKLLEAFLEKSDVSDSNRREELASLRTEKTTASGLSTAFVSWSSRDSLRLPSGILPSASRFIEDALRHSLRTSSRWSSLANLATCFATGFGAITLRCARPTSAY